MSRLSAFQRVAKIFKSGIVEPLLNFFCYSSALIAVFVPNHKVRNLAHSSVFFHFGNDDVHTFFITEIIDRAIETIPVFLPEHEIGRPKRFFRQVKPHNSHRVSFAFASRTAGNIVHHIRGEVFVFPARRKIRAHAVDFWEGCSHKALHGDCAFVYHIFVLSQATNLLKLHLLFNGYLSSLSPIIQQIIHPHAALGLLPRGGAFAAESVVTKLVDSLSRRASRV